MACKIERHFCLKMSLVILLLLFLAGTARAQKERAPLLLVSIDGFMSEYLERNETPNFDRIIDAGVLSEGLIPVFPTKTFPTHYSMVTGLYVENHGIISNRFHDDRLDAWFSFGPPPGAAGDGVWWGGEPVWVTAELQGKTAATMFWPGSDSEIKGVRPTRYMAYDKSVSGRARIDSVAAWLNPDGDIRADFATLYFSDIDSKGHEYGPRSAEVDRAVKEMDERLGYLMRRIEEIGLASRLNLIIVSDHGMAETSEERVIFLDDIINMEDVNVIDRSPVSMLRPAPGRRERVYRQLKENENGYKVYLKEDLPREFRFRSHYRIPDIIVIADVSYTIATRAQFFARGLLKGTHGYDHRAREMQALFLAFGPDFREHGVVEPLNSIHLYELMCHLLTIDPASNDGSFDAIRYLLKSR